MIPEGGWLLWLVEIVIGVAVLSVWHPVATVLGITQPWVTIIFIVGWVVFWATPLGIKTRETLKRIIRREG
jgi:hypothetical protein